MKAKIVNKASFLFLLTYKYKPPFIYFCFSFLPPVFFSYNFFWKLSRVETMSEEWVKEAMDDAMLAAEVLLSLVHAVSHQLPSSVSSPTTDQLAKNKNGAASSALRLEWSVRQLRSKQVIRRKGDSTRGSPTTPLSWSGGGTSGCEGVGADCSDESSRPSKTVDLAGSKVAATNETTPPKRSRKKKTLAELKEEMSSHLKENNSLKNELEKVKFKFENLRSTNEALSRKLKLEKDRATSESSKRIKLDYQTDQSSEPSATFVEPKNPISDLSQQGEVACHPTMPKGSSKVDDIATCEPSFMLPDLNLPVEE